MILEIFWTICLVGFVYIIANYCFQLFKMKGSPPGPFPLPIIGNLHLLGRRPHLTFKELSKKYGDVFRISFGTKRVVVINAIEPAKEALIQKGVEFAGRPTDMYTSDIVTRGGKDLIMADYGTMWRVLRKIAHSSLKMYGAGMGKLEKLILEEMDELIKRFDAKIDISFDPKDDICKYKMTFLKVQIIVNYCAMIRSEEAL